MKIFYTVLIAGFLIMLDVTLFSSSTGITGLTKRDGDVGCICHGNHKPTPGVSVFFTGPDSVATGQTVNYRIKLVHGPAVKGGFDAASFAGVIDTIAADTSVRRDAVRGELTHRFPKPFVNDTVFWTFKYTAPAAPMIDTLYAVANSTDNNGQADTTDQWNFGQNFPVRVYIPIGIANNGSIVNSYSLGQNYPNPFNPKTIINFELSMFNYVSLNVYDMLGRKVTTLVNDKLKPGKYKVEFDGSNLSSGIYFYRLIVSKYTETKKMILAK